MSKILQKGDPILEQISKEVPLEEISSSKIQNIISEMKNILSKTDDAVALAAPQIGELSRIFVISKKIFNEDPNENQEKKESEDLVFINPQIIKTSKEKVWAKEGCLSVRGFIGEVERPKKATIRAYDEKGESFCFGGSGLLSQAFQHETDHLNGILFTEKARNLRREDLE